MDRSLLACIVGARPNFMKMAPLLRAFEQTGHIEPRLIHTGQHYDAALSDVFFDELEMPRPDVSLGVGSGSHAVQTARLLESLEPVFRDGHEGRPYAGVIVVGDVNSTMAAALVAAKLHLPVHHVEAGLRSHDRTMPEEINRIVTDGLSELLFVSEPSGAKNLRLEGHEDSRIKLVGNVMIDTLLKLLPKARERTMLREHDLQPQQYGVVTMHRPANVDDEATLAGLLDVLIETAKSVPLVFPVHPRTEKRLAEFGLRERLDRSEIRLLGPAGYLDFLSLTSQARLIVTDSGGLQEESTVLGVPCLTMRPNTERPITVDEGTSTLVANSPQQLRLHLADILAGRYKTGAVPELWDGHAAERIAAIMSESLADRSAGRTIAA